MTKTLKAPFHRIAGPVAATIVLAAAPAARAQYDMTPHFSYVAGQAIYEHVCQGCHMPDANGAVGAGAYPALAKNVRLKSPAYPALVLINGQRAMPSFSGLSDEQISNVVNYIRTAFGNHYAKPISASEVKALRTAAP